MHRGVEEEEEEEEDKMERDHHHAIGVDSIYLLVC
jgi:hypothetical protein